MSHDHDMTKQCQLIGRSGRIPNTPHTISHHAFLVQEYDWPNLALPSLDQTEQAVDTWIGVRFLPRSIRAVMGPIGQSFSVRDSLKPMHKHA